MSADDFIAVPASDAGAAARLSAALSVLTTLRADPRQAVQEDSIRCLVCAGVFRQLTNTHLRAHGLSAAEYKTTFGYNRGRPLMCRTLARMYADRARRAGLAARIRQRPILLEPELRRRGGARSISLEELLTRREIRQREAVQRTESSAHIVGQSDELFMTADFLPSVRLTADGVWDVKRRRILRPSRRRTRR